MGKLSGTEARDALTLQPVLNIPQNNFLATKKKYRAFVAGYRAGKTFSGCCALAIHAYQFPRVKAGYFAPTYPQIRDIFYPTIEEALFHWGLRVKIKQGVHEVDVFRGNCYHGTIICRSMDNPGSIIGFKIGHALVDEIDTMATAKARDSWRKIIARMSYKRNDLVNGIDVTTTPEGFKFTYEQFVKLPRQDPKLAELYGVVHASTYSNKHNLPEDYIPSLLASYPSNLIDAYINGQFVNLQTGTVYSAYDRKMNACRDTIQPGETLYVGMDFNVGKMAAIVHVKRDGLPRAVDELVNGYDTPDMIRRIKERYWKHDGKDYRPTCQIRVYPDASGDSRKSVRASETDVALLRQAGFQVLAHGSNPPVKDRINAMNAMFCNAAGERRYLVNDEMCPTYADSLEQQAWAENGEPDKSSGHDHYCFSGGTKVETQLGICEIKDIPECGFIRTPDGKLSPYSHAGIKGKNKDVVRVVFDNGESVVCTPDHLFLTDAGWVKAVDLCETTCYKWLYHHGGEKWSRFCQKNSKSLMAKFTGYVANIFSGLAKDSIAQSMNFITGQFQRGAQSTTLMETGTTTTLGTSSLWTGANIRATTCRSRKGSLTHRGLFGAQSKQPQNGIGRKKEESGTRSSTPRRKIVFARLRRLLALCADRLTRLKTLVATSFAPRNVIQLGEESLALTMRTKYAQLAERYFKRISTSRSSIVLPSAEQQASGAKVVAVIPQLMAEDVYCLTVPSHGCFVLACGVVVSNCDAGGYFVHFEHPVVHRSTTAAPISIR